MASPTGGGGDGGGGNGGGGGGSIGGGVHDEPSPPQTSHLSNSRPDHGTPSQPAHVELSPAHTKHASSTSPLHGTPSQPAHERLSPPHTPHSSTVLPLSGTASQPPPTTPTPTESVPLVSAQSQVAWSGDVLPTPRIGEQPSRVQPPSGHAPAHRTHASTSVRSGSAQSPVPEKTAARRSSMVHWSNLSRSAWSRSCSCCAACAAAVDSSGTPTRARAATSGGSGVPSSRSATRSMKRATRSPWLVSRLPASSTSCSARNLDSLAEREVNWPRLHGSVGHARASNELTEARTAAHAPPAAVAFGGGAAPRHSSGESTQ